MGTGRDWALAAVAAWLRRYGLAALYYAALAGVAYWALRHGPVTFDRE